MAKYQFQATEDMLIRLPPFIKADGTYIFSGTNCTLAVVKPNGTLFAGSIDTPAQDTNTGHWKSRIPVAEYIKGTWLIKATSTDSGTPLPQFREIVWGEFDELTAIKAKTDNLPSDPADESLLEAAITAVSTKLGTPTSDIHTEVAAVKADTAAIETVTSALPTFPSDPASQTTLDVLAAVAVGKWTIDATTKQLILYQWSGGSWVEFRRFDLYDKDGVPSTTQVYSRIPH